MSSNYLMFFMYLANFLLQFNTCNSNFFPFIRIIIFNPLEIRITCFKNVYFKTLISFTMVKINCSFSWLYFSTAKCLLQTFLNKSPI